MECLKMVFLEILESVVFTQTVTYCYTLEQRAEVRKYAAKNRATNAVKHYTTAINLKNSCIVSP